MNNRQLKNFNIMADKMDKRHVFLSMLFKQYPTIEQCPVKWHPDWMAFEADGFKCWRDMPEVVARVKKAAKKVKK